MSLGEGSANRFQWLLFLQILQGLGSSLGFFEFLKSHKLISKSFSSPEVGSKSAPWGILSKSINPCNNSDSHRLFSVVKPSCSVLARLSTMSKSLNVQKADSMAGWHLRT